MIDRRPLLGGASPVAGSAALYRHETTSRCAAVFRESTEDGRAYRSASCVRDRAPASLDVTPTPF
ncbi:hypothetical protein [Nocardiopsis tropica]|uniref:Uncharacterized protein n=1 Tax=Nocardiopsis tropica TaxID=109330 RepID=A0ABU7KZJ7_9ACTN|nr:hypothetical protein [Nocardiopsis umidischolae]MEE2054708.1 hypothetical protein [Nocardiopsis umidischolae]